MEKPIALPAFATLPTAQELVQITHWLHQAGLHELELTNAQGLHIRLVSNVNMQPDKEQTAPQSTPHTPDQPALTPVVTPYFGHLRLQDPATRSAYAPVGTSVQAGQTVAMLDLGTITVAVQAPSEGAITSICAQENDLVGYGQTILFITAP